MLTSTHDFAVFAERNVIGTRTHWLSSGGRRPGIYFHVCRPRESGVVDPAKPRQALSMPVENAKKTGETMLTRGCEFAILVWLWECLSAGQGGLTLFDNRYDVPESVRNHPGFRARMD